jgi:DNA-binding transcriptional MocR family regulator
VSQPPTLTPAVRQALVRQLLADQPTLSNRDIAAQLGVSKDTVRRDRAEVSRAQDPPAPQPAPVEPEAAPHAPPSEADPAPRDPLDEPLRNLLTPEARADLTLLMEAGHSPGYAVRRGLEVLADTYRGAWERGLYPRGTAPEITYISVSTRAPKGPTP